MSKQFFFVHGGPGFTSKPEEAIIGPLLPKDTSITFWNELSPLRGTKDTTNFFQQNLKHLEKELTFQLKQNAQLTPIFFSFGLQYLLNLSDDLVKQFKKIILIAPAADLSLVDRNIFQLALKDFKSGNPASYDQLTSMLKELGPQFDQKKIDAFLLASTAPTLFTNYFNSQEAMMSYFGHLAGEFAFCVESFLAIRSSLPLPVSKRRFTTPTMALFGKLDPITPFNDQNQILRQHFSQVECLQFDSHKHFLHIENPQVLLNCFL